jgi:hypothetical protein
MISEESPSRAEGLFSTVSNDAGYFVGSVPGLSTPQYAAATPILVVPLPPTSTLHIALPSDTLATAGPPIATVAPSMAAYGRGWQGPSADCYGSCASDDPRNGGAPSPGADVAAVR